MTARDTLRFAYLPSDFHPLVLFLGEADALNAFAAALRKYAADREPADVERWSFASAADGTRIRLTGEGAEPGLRAAGETGAYTWTLQPWQAEMFAEELEELADPDNRSGSTVLECEAPGEIPVKVSLGEFTDDFFRLPVVLGERLRLV